MDEALMDNYKDLENRLKEVDKVIQEGNAARSFIESEFFSIFNKIYHADINFYKEECFKAAKSRLSNITNYLGRQEGVESFYDKVVHRLVANMDKALEHKRQIQQDMSELIEEMQTPNYGSHDVGE